MNVQTNVWKTQFCDEYLEMLGIEYIVVDYLYTYIWCVHEVDQMLFWFESRKKKKMYYNIRFR